MRQSVSARSLVLLLVLAHVGCGSNPQAPSAPPPRAAAPVPVIVELTLVSADIQGHMANGEHWDRDGQKSDVTPPAMASYLAQHPELADTRSTVGIPVTDSKLKKRARESRAADPMVLIEVAGQVFRSPVRPRAFQPIWDFPLRFAVADPAAETVRLHVVDYDGPDKFDAIGSTVLSLADLTAKPVHTLKGFGRVDTLILQVRTWPVPKEQPTPTGTRLAVLGKPSWTDTGIRVIAGQQVHLTAADEVCTTLDDRDDCSGPEGQSEPHSANLSGFGHLGHGALVAEVGDTRFAVGRELRIVAPASGVLRLGVNDGDSRNNKGAYAVHVVVKPPALADSTR